MRGASLKKAVSCLVSFGMVMQLGIGALAYDGEDDHHLYVSSDGYYFSVHPGESAHLEVTVDATDTEGLTYSWSYYDQDDYRYVVIDGADGASYDTEPFTAESEYHNCSYQCTVEDSYGDSNSCSFYVYLDNDFYVQAGENYGNEYVHPGDSVDMVAIVSAYDTDGVTYRWTQMDLDTYEETEIEGVTGDTLNTGAVTGQMRFICYVADKYGFTDAASFYVYCDNELTLTSNNSNYPVHPGECAELEVEASAYDDTALTFQWSEYSSDPDDYGWHEIEGATGTTYTTDPVYDNVEFLCVVSDQYGNQKDVYINAYVDNELSVPDSYEYLSVYPGETATLTPEVTAYDMTGVTYKWTYDDPDTYDSITVGTESSFTTPEINGYTQYTCAISDPYHSTVYVYYNIDVTNDLEISTEKSTYEIHPGDEVEFSVTATAHDMEGLTYSWWYYDESTYQNVKIEGETGTTYSPDLSAGYTQYMCLVTDKYNKTAYQNFYVNIDNELSIDGESTRYVSLGDTVELSVTVSGYDTTGLTYSWSIIDDNYSWTTISGATGSSYTTDAITGYSRYVCTVADLYGSTANQYFYINIDNNLTAVADNGVYTVAPGEDVTLTVNVSATDTDGITYEWYINGRIDSTVTGPSCTLNSVTGYTYAQCYVYDKYNNSKSVYFTVNIDNNLSVSVSDSEVMVPYGESTTITVNATATDMTGMTYSWYEYSSSGFGRPISNNTNILTLDSVTEARSYECTVTDKYGNSVYAFFTVGVDNALTVSAEETEYTVDCGDDVTLTVDVSATDMQGITYKWFPDGSYSDQDALDNNTNTCTINNVTSRQTMRCLVTDKFGNSKNVYFTVSIDNQLAVDIGTTDYGVPYGGDVTLSASFSALDMEGIAYSWYKKDPVDYSEMPLTGCTSNSIELTNITESADYTCYAVDKYNNRVGVVFHVYVDNGLTATTNLISCTVDYGDSITLSATVTANDMTGMTYAWYRHSNGYSSGVLVASGTTSYTVDNVTSHETYEFLATDRYNNTAGIMFEVGVSNNLIATSASSITSYSVASGSDLTLSVTAIADDMEGLTYSWTGYDSHGTSMYVSCDSASLQLTDITESCSYSCTVTDKYGNYASVYFSIGIMSDQYEVTTSQSVFHVNYGDSVDLGVTVTPSGIQGLTYTWSYIEAVPDVGVVNWVIEGADTSSYRINFAAYPTTYQCTVTDSAGCRTIVDFQILFTGWQKIDGTWYYYDDSGLMQTSWQKIGGTWYYFEESGAMVSGWKKLSGTWYYFNASGAMQTGWQKIGGSWYYFNASGAMQSGWQKIGGSWYYFNASGAMQSGWQKIGGSWYYFNASGAMQTGWQKIGGSWYYFNASGAMQSGWQKIGGSWYYFNASGAMQTGWQKIGSSWYYFNASGAMQTGWLKVGSTWYYFDGLGHMVTGNQTIGNKVYRFSSSGACLNPY